MSNMLTSGAGAPVAPNLKDQEAVPPGGNSVAMPAPGPSDMMQHFGSAEDQAEAQMKKVEEADGQLSALRSALDGLSALADTVTMDDLVEAAAGMVAAGIPAVQVASSLAEAPDQPGQLEGWVQEKLQQLAPAEEQMKKVKAQAGFTLAKASMESLIAHSAEEHYHKSRLAAMPPQGSA